ncbi:MAG: hypothetical protein Kow00108_14120 [Calditrichia bacterium]
MKRLYLIILGIMMQLPLFSQSMEEALSIGMPIYLGTGYTAAMGAANTALLNGSEAMGFNPAGLAGSTQSSLSIDLVSHYFNNDARFFHNQTSYSKYFANIRSINISLALPATRGSASIGLGYNRVKDLDYSLNFSGFNTNSNGLGFEVTGSNNTVELADFDRNVHQEEFIINRGGIGMYSLGGAMAVAPGTLAGISLDYYRGSSDYTQLFEQTDVNNVYNQFPADFYSYSLNRTLNQTFSGFGIRLGIIAELSESFQLGAMYQSPIRFTVDEIYNENDDLVFDDGYEDAYDYGTYEYGYNLKMPAVFSAAVGWQSYGVSLSARFDFRDWTTMEFSAPDIADDFSAFQSLNNNIQRNLKATINQHIGAAFQLPGDRVTLRAGFVNQPSPYNSLAEEESRKTYTGGVEVKLNEHFSLNLALVHQNYQQISEDSFTPGGTTEDINSSKMIIGFNYRY